MKMKYIYYLSTVIVFSFIFFSCKKKDNLDGVQGNAQPQILIDSIKLSGFNSIVVFTSIKNNSSVIIEKGQCWDTLTNPTIQKNKKLNSGTNLVFSDTIADLLPSTTYHIKSFLTSGSNVTYSEAVTINTKTLTTVYNKMYIGPNPNTPTIIGVVGNEVDGFVVCSHISPQVGSYRWLRLTKLDADGNIIWQKDHNDGTWKEPHLIKQLSDGYLIGLHYFQTGIGEIRSVLQKFDLNGNFVWERQFKKDDFQFFMRLAVRENDFRVTMKALTNVNFNNPAFKVALWDFTVDKNGTITSEQEYPNFIRLANSTSWYHSIEAPDGGFIGYCDSVYNIGCCSGNTNIEVQRFGPQNTLMWKKTYGGPETEYVAKGVGTTDGNYLISGTHYTKPSLAQARLLKINFANGNVLWEKLYGKEISGGCFTYVGDLIQHVNTFYLTGNTCQGAGYIVKFDEAGNQKWDYFIPMENGYQNFPQKIYVSPKQDIYVFGTKNNDRSQPAHLWIMKLTE